MVGRAPPQEGRADAARGRHRRFGGAGVATRLRLGWRALGLILLVGSLTACASAPAPGDGVAPPADRGREAPAPAGPEAGGTEPEAPAAPGAEPAPPAVEPAWETGARPEEGIHGVAVWPGTGDRPWLLATAAATHRLLLFDADTGEALRDFGGRGEGDGRFRDPRGVAVVDDLALVAERGGGRVQVLRLPGLSTLGSVGAGVLDRPEGLAVVRRGTGDYELFVSDDARTAAGGDPRPARRLYRFRVRTPGGELESDLVAVVPVAEAGDPVAATASLAVDGALRHLLLAVGDPAAGELRVFAAGEDTGGGLRRRGTVRGLSARPAGVALYPCRDGAGYWLVAVPGGGGTALLVLDRAGLQPVGELAVVGAGRVGDLWLSTVPTPELPGGALYAVNPVGSVLAFDWRVVAETLGLRADCAGDGK